MMNKWKKKVIKGLINPINDEWKIIFDLLEIEAKLRIINQYKDEIFFNIIIINWVLMIKKSLQLNFAILIFL